MNNKQIGIINEIGDLGLGFDPLSENDQKILEEQEKHNPTTESNKEGE